MFIHPLLISLLFVSSTVAQITVTINFANVTHTVSPTLFGIFFEEINHAGEGGLYAELVQNRGFNEHAPAATPKGSPQSRRVDAPAPVSLRSFSQPGFFVRHCDYAAYITPVSSFIDLSDSTFNQIPGLAGSGYTSFEAIALPGYYLRHFNFRLTLAKSDGTTQFDQDSSFKLVPGLANAAYSSFEASNHPGYYIAFNSSNGGPCNQVGSKHDLFLIHSPSPANATFAIVGPNMNPIFPWEYISAGAVSPLVTLDSTTPLNANNKNSAKIVASVANTGIANTGFWGINVQNDKYTLSYFIRTDGAFKGQLVITLESQTGDKVYAKVVDEGPFSQAWEKKNFSFGAVSGVDTTARLAIRLTTAGTVWLDEVSVFPTTFNNRPNGLRKDLATSLQDLAPKFLRFPGGNFVEGYNKQSAFLWKNTTGPIETRPGHMGVWGYWSSDGLGILEYLLLCEDLKMDPIWVINIGIFLGDGSIPLNEIDPWVQDALDSLEYITGPATSTWGSVRAKSGHPAPFDLKIIALGNENGCGFDSRKIYVSYYNVFAAKIRAAYPQIRFIANCDISGSTKDVDLFDYHVYESPSWFLQNANVFDRQNRKGPAVFVSEYAVTQNAGFGNLQAAVSEAAFMTGLVRNSDIVQLASYAPLFVHVNDRTWNPDAIQFDNHAIAPTPSYYVQLLFMHYTGDKHLAAFVANGNLNFASVATYSSAKGLIYIPIVNFSPQTTSVNIRINGANNLGAKATVYVLSSPSGNPMDENTITDPHRVSISQTTLDSGAEFAFKALPYSVSIISVPASK